jgi:hypothetical protein
LTVRVRELIQLLSSQAPDAIVVIEDPDGRPLPAVRGLRSADVRQVAVSLRESNGIGWVELGGSCKAVLLGELTQGALGDETFQDGAT